MPHGIAVEQPITSYFRRVSASSHKQSSHVVLSTSKRQRLPVLHSSQEDDASKSKKPRTRQKIAPSDASRNRSKASHEKTRISSPNRGPSSPGRTASHTSRRASTPLVGNELFLSPSDIGFAANLEVKSSSGIGQVTDDSSRQFNSVTDRHKQYDSIIQTPPPTMLPRRAYSTSCKGIQSIPLTTNGCESSPCPNSLPARATISRRIASSGCAGQNPPFKHAKPDLFNLTSARPHNHISTIWGSSRERGRDDDDDGNPFADTRASEMLVLSSQTQEVDVQPLQMLSDTFLVPLLPERKFSCDISDPESDGFIQSSQSQHVLPHHISPRRKGADQRFDFSFADNSTLEEIVPSSQSQTELELSVSTWMSDYLAHVMPRTKAGLPQDLPSAPELNMSSIPLQDMISSREGTTNGFDPVPTDPTDSATEDESEDESSIRHTHRTRSPHISSSDTGVTPGSDEAAEETAEYMNSLPHTVQDFEVMFGESSGSLPGDFPLSLQ